MGVTVRQKVKNIGNPLGGPPLGRRQAMEKAPPPLNRELKGGWWVRWPAGPSGDSLDEGAKPFVHLKDD